VNHSKLTDLQPGIELGDGIQNVPREHGRIVGVAADRCARTYRSILHRERCVASALRRGSGRPEHRRGTRSKAPPIT
jgi:hypothetical protein